MSKEFEKVVREGIALAKEVRSATTFGDARDEKLSKRAYLDEALKNAKTTPDKLRALDKLMSRDPGSYPHAESFVGAVFKGAASTEGGCNLRPVVGNLHILAGGRDAFIGVMTEALLLGSNPLELVALGVLRAVELHPDNFGNIDDWDRHQQVQAARAAKLEEVEQAISSSWSPEDVAFCDLRPDGYARINFRWKDKDTGVSVMPHGDAGRRLLAVLGR